MYIGKHSHVPNVVLTTQDVIMFIKWLEYTYDYENYMRKETISLIWMRKPCAIN